MRVKVLIVIGILLILLGWRFWAHFGSLQDYIDGQRVSFRARLAEEPDVGGGRQRFAVFDSLGRRVFITTSMEVLYHYGDKLFIDGIFTVKEKSSYLYFPNIQIVSSEHDYLSKIDVYIKNTSQNVFNRFASPTSAGLLLGMVFGGKQGLPGDFVEKLRVTGVMHVIAASGMNVTFVAGALLSLLGRCMRRQFVLVFSIGGVCFYAFLAGFEPSIARATIMIVIALAAGLLGRYYYALAALFFTGYVMLLYRPIFVFDVGFQLSFLSTLGILVIKQMLPFPKRFLMDDVGTTVAAQMMTLPILLGTFGQYGVLSVLVNALVLWTIPYLMVLGALGAIWGMLWGEIGGLFVWVSLPFLWYFERVVSFFADQGWVWRVDNIPWQVGAGYYFILMGIVVGFSESKKSNLKEQNLFQISKF
jgi:competence protein ComEC